MIDAITFQPIGIIHSSFKEKFGIPRQPGLAPSANADLELLGDFASPDAVRGLEECSHLWLIFLFSEHLERGWTPLVRPPRAQGGKRGVFATRATFRPNPIGLSVVKLEQVAIVNGRARLNLSGVDLLDGTPVLDIKPYLPYADSLPDAHYTWAADGQQQSWPVRFSHDAEQAIAQHPEGGRLRSLIEEVLCCDPRPSHQRKSNDRLFGIHLENVNVRWRMQDSLVEVLAIEPRTDSNA